MRRRIVCDASAIVALLLDSGPDGQWASEAVRDADLAAPTLLGYEVDNVIRRLERAGTVSPDQAAQAHADFLDLTVELWPYDAVAPRAWELRPDLSSYDAAYVAVAEFAGTSLVTLDRRIGRAPGVRCPVHSAPARR